MHEAGDFELMVAEGNYFVCAFQDQNSNLVYDASEPAGQYGEPKPVAAPAGGVVLEINFVIPEKSGEIGLRIYDNFIKMALGAKVSRL